MRIRATVLALAATGVAGCYTQTTIPPAALASLGAPLGKPKRLSGDARLGPRTEVSIRFSDGAASLWMPAADLAVAKEGLITGPGRHALTDAHEVVIFEPAPGAESILAATAPPGAVVTPTEDRLLLQVDDPRWLLAWVAAYLDGTAALGCDPGVLSFRGARGAWTSAPIPGRSLATLAPGRLGRLKLAEGVPWREVEAVELNNLDPWSTTGAILASPVLVLGALLLPGSPLDSSAALANPTTDLRSPAPAVDAEEQERTADDPADVLAAARRYRSPSVLIDGDEGTAGARPLFSPRARRRDQLKLVLGGDFGFESADRTLTGSAGVGLRLFDFMELTGRVRTVTFDDWGHADAAGSNALSRHLLGGARLALHLEAHGDPLIAFVAGGELLAGSLSGGGTLTELGLVAGPRIGLGDRMFASLLFEPSVLMSSNTGTADHDLVRLMFCAELGFDLERGHLIKLPAAADRRV